MLRRYLDARESVSQRSMQMLMPVLAYAIAHNIHTQARQGERTQQTKGIHVTENIDISAYCYEHQNWYYGSQSYRVVWSAA